MPASNVEETLWLNLSPFHICKRRAPESCCVQLPYLHGSTFASIRLCPGLFRDPAGLLAPPSPSEHHAWGMNRISTIPFA